MLDRSLQAERMQVAGALELGAHGCLQRLDRQPFQQRIAADTRGMNDRTQGGQPVQGRQHCSHGIVGGDIERQPGDRHGQGGQRGRMAADHEQGFGATGHGPAGDGAADGAEAAGDQDCAGQTGG